MFVALVILLFRFDATLNKLDNAPCQCLYGNDYRSQTLMIRAIFFVFISIVNKSIRFMEYQADKILSQ